MTLLLLLLLLLLVLTESCSWAKIKTKVQRVMSAESFLLLLSNLVSSHIYPVPSDLSTHSIQSNSLPSTSTSTSTTSKHPTLPNLTNIKDAHLLHTPHLQRLPQPPRRLQDILLGQNPSTPVHAQGATTAGVEKDLDGVTGIGVHGAHDVAGLVGADGDEAEVERAAVLADGCEGWAAREVGVCWGPVVCVGGGGRGWHGPVAGVAGEEEGLGRGGVCGGWGADGP